MSKRLLIIDTESQGLDLAMRAQTYGWEVAWWNKPNKDGYHNRCGEGIITKIKDFDLLRSRYLHWADLIWLTGNASYMEMLEPFRGLGFPIYGGGVESASWELDRAVGQKVMKRAGLNVIPGKEFHDYDAAIAYVKKHGTPFVSKPSGEADKEMSYVAESADDLCYFLNKCKQNEKYVKAAAEHGFILQEKMSGCEMGVSGWFGPHGWSQYWEEDFEFKKLMNDDLGPNTGEQGTLLRFVEDSKLADIALRPLTEQLHAIGYVGCINVNGCIDEAGEYWPYEFTMREGWPAKSNEMALQPGDPVQWMLDLVNGKDTMQCNTEDVSISVVVTLPPFPSKDAKDQEIEGVPIYDCGDAEHIHLVEVMLGEMELQADPGKWVSLPCYQTTGYYVMVVTGTGQTITGARKSAYTAARHVKKSIPKSPQYRTDIGRSKLVDELPRIQKLGFAKGLKYA